MKQGKVKQEGHVQGNKQLTSLRYKLIENLRRVEQAPGTLTLVVVIVY